VYSAAIVAAVAYGIDSIEFAPLKPPFEDDDDDDAPLLDASSNLCSRTEDASIFFFLLHSLSLSFSLSLKGERAGVCICQESL